MPSACAGAAERVIGDAGEGEGHLSNWRSRLTQMRIGRRKWAVLVVVVTLASPSLDVILVKEFDFVQKWKSNSYWGQQLPG